MKTAPDRPVNIYQIETVVYDEMTLSTAPRYDRSRVSNTGGEAIVIGASMAGLLTARVLADAYETVTVIERDSFPDTPTSRRGVPQGSHVHILLEAGRVTIEDFFPNFGRELRSAGGLVIDGISDLNHYEHGGYLADGPERLPLYTASRPLFEQVVREQLAERDEIILRPNCQFVQYRLNDTETTVTGIKIRDGDETTTLAADLVVDATGRTSKTPQWLERQGYQSPPVEEISVDVAYSTVVIDRPADTVDAYLVAPSPAHPRGGTAVPIENDRWMVTLFGMHGENPPTDAEGLIEYAETLPVSDLHRLLTTREWISDSIEHYPFPANLRRRYEALDRFPEGLLVTGDGIASFNPIYGQGISVAALEALQLHHAIAEGPTETIADTFFTRASDVVDIVWKITVGGDFAFPQTEGNKPLGTDLFNRYISRLVRAAQTDGQLRHEYYKVVRLEDPPTALLHPSVLGRVVMPNW